MYIHIREIIMSLKTMNKPKQQHAVGPEVQKELQ